MTITIIRQAPSATEANIRYTQENVTLHVTPVSTLIQHPGTLYIADECLYFYSAGSNAGLAIQYPSIIIHAIARESRVGPSIYCQLEGSLAVFEPAKANGHIANGASAEDNEDEEEDEDAVLELSFVPADVSSLDTIYENLSYCASLHQDEDAEDYNMDEDDYYDDVNDHDGLYADADIQGGYIPKLSSATAIGVAPSSTTGSSSTAEGAAVPMSAAQGEVEQVPAIDLQNGEWYTGDPETDAKFELSEQGQVILNQWQNNQSGAQGQTQGKRSRLEDEGEDQDMAEDSESAPTAAAEAASGEELTEEQVQEARSKMWRAY